jgi:hypothetical protein
MELEITKTFSITRGGIHFNGALIQADTYRVVGGFTYVSVQAIKDDFVTFCVKVPRNRRNLVRNAAKDAGIFEGI